MGRVRTTTLSDELLKLNGYRITFKSQFHEPDAFESWFRALVDGWISCYYCYSGWIVFIQERPDNWIIPASHNIPNYNNYRLSESVSWLPKNNKTDCCLFGMKTMERGRMRGWGCCGGVTINERGSNELLRLLLLLNHGHCVCYLHFLSAISSSSKALELVWCHNKLPLVRLLTGWLAAD